MANTLRTNTQSSLLDIRALILIYLLLSVLSIFLSRIFFTELLQPGELVDSDWLIVIFLTILAVLLIFLVISILSLFRDFRSRRMGSQFQTRLLVYFTTIVVFAVFPFAFITNLSVNEILRFWKSINIEAAMTYAQGFALDSYSLRLEQFEFHIQNRMKGDFDSFPPDVVAAQDFVLGEDGDWTSVRFVGDKAHALETPSSVWQGFATREMPRDVDVIRYALSSERSQVRLITCHLGTGFDEAIQSFANEKERFDVINSLRLNMDALLLFYYGAFFFPTLIMTLIIAISFARRVSQPLVDLVDATRRVAGGDFSIHIITRRSDELGLLVHSFNTMVRELERSQAMLMKVEKISIWQTMAQQLAHEIKNPLTPIKLSAERVLRRWHNTPERIGEILENSMLAIIQETEGLSTLLNEFRTLSRPMEPSLSWTRVQELVKRTVVPYKSSHPNILFNIEHINASVAVKLDRHRLSQVLTNLIINAIDAMSGEGLIEIRTDTVRKRDSQYCRISIRDTGKGIPPDEKSRVFTPYFTTKESGTGLGLPIVERIVNEHGGNIWFHSDLDVGATFFIDLPIASEAEVSDTSQLD
ncbi:MAG: HAMP domain-containing protein [Treponema sp.]|jgi:nitrogen fixation/metabolism regulation signal transduction histidine kinase|nr:HAMP domain-containing protein [Treponema sp.]